MQKLNKKLILNIIKKGGASLDKNGKIASIKEGYQVSIKDGATIDLANINAIIERANTLFNNLPDEAYLGFWIDEGKIYIDYSKTYNSKLFALTIGNIYNQIAIWDNANGCNIYCTELKSITA